MTMRKKYGNRVMLIGFSLMLFLLWGCASSPASRFYTLSSLPSAGKGGEGKPLAKGLVIGVGPIKFPEYLERLEIVTRSSGETINRAEFDLWAGSLKDSFMRTLAENLSILLETDKIILYPSAGVITTDFRIVMDIVQFEGALGEQVSLVARWAIKKGKDNSEGTVQRSQITRPVQGSDYQALVAALSQALAGLSQEIAQGIRSVP
jgi:uncharacterized protein